MRLRAPQMISLFVRANCPRADDRLGKVPDALHASSNSTLPRRTTTYGMPLVVELGVFFDLLVATMVLGILVYRIRETFDSVDVSKLRRLRG